MTFTTKPWGSETLLEHNDQYVVKLLTMKEGCRCSLQYHVHKKETIFVVSGVLDIQVDDQTYRLRPQEYITINPGQHHRMSAADGPATYLEASTPHLDDVVRVQDDYGRTI